MQGVGGNVGTAPERREIVRFAHAGVWRGSKTKRGIVCVESALAYSCKAFYDVRMFNRFVFPRLFSVICGSLCFSLLGESLAPKPLVDSVTRHVLRKNRDGLGTTWFHPKVCLVPGLAGEPSSALMALQEITGSDYFGPVHWSESRDLGDSWTEPRRIEALDRIPVAQHEGLLAGVCDVVPEYHPQTGTVLALGQVVFYRGDRFSNNDQLPRYPVYAVRRSDGTWGRRRRLHWDDPRGSFIYSNNCGQRVVLPNGDILLAFTFGTQSESRSVASVRCSFDGEELLIKEVGPALLLAHGRGLLEPSLTSFKGRYYLTIRAEDGKGYQSVSDDGLNWQAKEAWRWEDGEQIFMSSTQQHWLTHSEGLYLVYTRRDEANKGVIRWRAPLWMARVNPDTRRLFRATERVIFPLVGDGVGNPDQVALMGNFHVTNITPSESWITVGEWIPKDGARGDLLLAKIRWKQANQLLLQ